MSVLSDVFCMFGIRCMELVFFVVVLYWWCEVDDLVVVVFFGLVECYVSKFDGLLEGVVIGWEVGNVDWDGFLDDDFGNCNFEFFDGDLDIFGNMFCCFVGVVD